MSGLVQAIQSLYNHSGSLVLIISWVSGGCWTMLGTPFVMDSVTDV